MDEVSQGEGVNLSFGVSDYFGTEITEGSWLALPGIERDRPLMSFARVTGIYEQLISVIRYEFWSGSWVTTQEERASLFSLRGSWIVQYDYLPHGLKSILVAPPVRALTDTQRRIYEYLEACIAKNGFPPTRAEIAKHFGYKSNNSAEDHPAGHCSALGSWF